MVQVQVGEIHARAPQAVPAKVAINMVDAGKGLRTEIGILVNFHVFDGESGARQQTERHGPKLNRPVQRLLQTRPGGGGDSVRR